MNILMQPFLLVITILIVISCNNELTEKESLTYKHDFEISKSSYGTVLKYTLENGIQVLLKVDENEPKINANIAFKVGSKNDPENYTGLAHYLEHMLFKGTSKLGTVNWEKESALLDSITLLYEKHYEAESIQERRKIYAQIDKVSGEAANYAVANEYDKLMAAMGATGTNAYTSNEETVYMTTIPSNELNKWLQIESERFSELTLRLFHTELESVYEEYNISQDSDWATSYGALMENLFKRHQYGTRRVLGKGEHLKAPSLVQIKKFFETYYVPNNMGIIMSGDIEPDKTIDLIEQYFGGYKKKELPKFEIVKEKEIEKPIEVEVIGNDMAWVNMGYRISPENQKEKDIMTLLNEVFSNGTSGLLDLNLIKEQKLQSAFAFVGQMKDYSMFYLRAVPNPKQSLEEVRELLLTQIEALKKGDFPDWMLKAIIKNFKKRKLQASTYAQNWTYTLTEFFIYEKDIATSLNSLDRLSKISKQDIVDFANKTFQDNHVTVYKKNGKVDREKVEKPEITQVTLNRDKSSLFFRKMEELTSSTIEPVFPDYSKLEFEEFGKKQVEYLNVKNDIDDLFSLEYIVEMGDDHDLLLPHAINYAKFLGTDSLSPKEIEQEFYKLGVDFYAFAGSTQSYLGISGLKESFKPALKLFEHLLSNLKADQEVYNTYVQQVKKEREDSKLDRYEIYYGAADYAKFGGKTPLNNILSVEKLKKQNVNKLAGIIHDFTSYKHIVYLNANDDNEELKKTIKKYHKLPAKLKDIPDPIVYKEQEINTNRVYFVHYDMVQAFVGIQAKGKTFNKDLIAPTKVFNSYFGSGISSIVFQEIRESKALAYSCFAYYSTPKRIEKSHYLEAFVGTQVDKVPDAIPAITELLVEMPIVEKQIQEAISGVLKEIESNRVRKESWIYDYLSNRKLGLNKTKDEIVYPYIKKMTSKKLINFFNKYIKSAHFNYVIIGDKNKLDMDFIKSLGEYRELNLEDIFGE